MLRGECRSLRPFQDATHIPEHLFLESLGPETQRVIPHGARIEIGTVSFELLDAGDEAFDRLLAKPHAGRSGAAFERHNRLRSAAAGQGDDWSAARLRFHGYDAEVLFAGE